MSEETPEEGGDAASGSIDLVRRAQDGEEEALNRLLERYYDRVRRVVHVRMGKRVRAGLDSLDVVQETFSAAVLAFDRFEMRDEASLLNWLSRIAEHKILEALDRQHAAKRDRRREVGFNQVIDAEDGSEVAFEPEADTVGPAERVAEREQAQIVDDCLQELRERHREVIVQRDFLGASWKTIAGWMDCPSPDAARTLYARALAALADRVRRRRLG